jgi:hypothetical protein
MELTKLFPSQLAIMQWAHGLANSVAKLPSTGWNSWNAFGCNITEPQFLSAAEKMVSLGQKVWYIFDTL